MAYSVLEKLIIIIKIPLSNSVICHMTENL